MGRVKDLKGQVFGELTVIRQNGINKQNRAMWLCKCSCGIEKTISSHDLQHGTVSCGHVQRETGKKNLIKARAVRDPIVQKIREEKAKAKAIKESLKPKPKHKRLAKIYEGMNARCYNPSHMAYKSYHGKGVIICDEWLNDYYKFEEWALENGYKDNLSIDRIDNNGIYEPSNCRWATHTQQMNNKCNNVFIEINGETRTVAQWARKYGIKDSTIRMRIEYGKVGEELLSPVWSKDNG